MLSLAVRHWIRAMTVALEIKPSWPGFKFTLFERREMAGYAAQVPSREIKTWAWMVFGAGAVLAVSFLMTSFSLLVLAIGGVGRWKTLSTGIVALWLLANLAVMASLLLPLALLAASGLTGAFHPVPEAELPNQRMTEYYFVKTRRQFLRVGIFLAAALAVAAVGMAVAGWL